MVGTGGTRRTTSHDCMSHRLFIHGVCLFSHLSGFHATAAQLSSATTDHLEKLLSATAMPASQGLPCTQGVTRDAQLMFPSSCTA